MNRVDVKESSELESAPGWLRWSAIVAGLVGFILFIATPLLPVNQTQSSLTWPQNGSLNSVNAPLISVAPESIEAAIPLAATQYLREDQTMVYGTVPADSKQATERGLFVNYNADAGLVVTSLDEVIFDLSPAELKQVPATETLHLAVTEDALTVRLGKYTEETEEDLRPQVTGVYTELEDTPEAMAALGELRVDVEINSRFTSAPTLLKLLAMWLGLAMVMVSLFALARIDRLDGHRRGFMPTTWKQIRPLDAVVAAVLLFWYVLGANTSDDGYILTMARVSENADYMANYYRWYGVPESPFGSPYYDLLGIMAQISTASIFMRLPSLVAALCVWFILSREILPRFGGIVNSGRVGHWTAALMFLAFWLPYNNGTRPEPMVALGVMFTWASFERAIATRRLLPAAVGTIAATVTLAVGPTGLFAVGVFLVSLPQVFRILGERARAAGWPAVVAPFLACGTAIMVLVFGDQTLAAVLESTSVRAAVGPALPWYSEYVRYATLFDVSVDGSLTRRFAVIVMFACLSLIAYAFIKDQRVVGAETGPTARLLMIMGLSAFFLMFTPTKWTHHFGVYAGVAGVIAALGAVVLYQIARRSSRARTFALAAVVFLMAISLAGWNAYWYVSSFGIPWWDRTVQLKGVEANSVVLVIALLILAAGIAQSVRAEQRKDSFATQQAFAANERARMSSWAGLMSAPIAIACAAVITLSLLSVAKAYVDQWPAYSIGKGNLAALAGNSCGMANDVLVETNTNDSFLTPVSGSLSQAFRDPDGRGFGPDLVPSLAELEDESTANAIAKAAATAGTQKTLGTNEDPTQDTEEPTSGALPFGLRNIPVVGSYTEDQVGTAELTSQWFHLPAHSADAPLLVVSAAGKIFHHDVNGIVQDGEDIHLEYGRLDGAKVVDKGEAEFALAGGEPKWRNLRLPLDSLPDNANVVRLVAKDTSLAEDDWLAFTPPRVPTVAPLNDIYGAETPALLDWSVPLQFPCQRTFDHYAGVTEIPEYRILPDAAAQSTLSDFQSYSGGGAMATAEAVNYSYEIPAYLNHDWSRDWGSVEKYQLRTNSAGQAPDPAHVDHEVITRTGWWKNSDMRVEEK
ncbi:arabinosyltransferase [Corynebacterium phocae]|uniref:Arabinosyltransferase n=1 Tax=Corynebacterium phocae TaxID=161895 RepID=A0A1L7D6A1_9CORY|nr:arabinosyltransferase [Corynebacterium phocae]KAA8728619.1 arabinosyltransferase [Corynebacterium phocae]